MASLREIRRKIKVVGFWLFIMTVVVSNSVSAVERTRELYQQDVEAGLKAQNLQAAFMAWHDLRVSYPGDPHACSRVDLLLNANQQQNEKNRLTAPQITELMTSCPPRCDSGDCLLWEKGMAAFGKTNYESAQKYFERLTISYPESMVAEKAFLYVAECNFYMGKIILAGEQYKAFLGKYPSSAFTELVRARIEYLRGK